MSEQILEILEEEESGIRLDRYLTEGMPEYVLVTWRQLPQQFTRYRQIAYANGMDQYNQPRKDFFLYQRIDP